VRDTRDAGEPLSRGQVDRSAADAKALRETVFFVAFFAGVVLVNGILAILFIALIQALGWWAPVAAETTFVYLEGAEELRASLGSFTGRQPSGAT